MNINNTNSNPNSQQRINNLKKRLPSILSSCTELQKESTKSFAGPCPRCGGTDRFVYKTDSERCWCRKCHEKPMDVIDFHCWLSGKSNEDLFREYLPEQQAKFKQNPKFISGQDESPDIQKIWDNILNDGYNEELIKKLLCHRRKISENIVKALIDEGKLRFKKHAKRFSVAIPFTTLQGDVMAIQCLSVDSEPYPFTIKNGKPVNKVFIKGSLPGQDCFFIAGHPIKTAKKLIINESVINAITAYECFPETCCIALGGSTYTKKVNALKPYMNHIEKVVVCIDNDEPSNKMLRAIWNILKNKVYSFTWNSNDKPGYDINDVLQAEQRDRIINLINNSKIVTYKQDGRQKNALIDSKEWKFAKEQFSKIQFPWDVLPKELEGSFKQLARSCASSSTHLPGIAFGILAAVLGRHVDVTVKSSWSEPLIFWMLALLPSGQGKSPAQNALSLAIYDEQEKLDKIHEKALERWKALPTNEQKQTQKPKSSGGFFSSDTTIEGLRYDQRMCGGVLISNDEASSFFAGQNQYKKGGKGTDRESWLKLYDGYTARIVRASGVSFIKGARTSIIGGTQPSVFFRIFKNDDNGNDIFLVDGTLFRFMMTWEGDKFYPMVKESWDDNNQSVWKNLIQNALQFCKEHTKINANGEEDIREIHHLCFSEKTLERFIEWVNNNKSITPQLPEQIRGFIPKLTGWAVRLTGIIKCMESFLKGTSVPQIIELEDLQKGIQLAEFYMSHNVNVIQAIVEESTALKKDTYSDREIQLVKTLQGIKGNIDNGRLALSFILGKYNEDCPPELQFKSSQAIAGLIRSCNLTILGGKHDANGKRAVFCLKWDENTDMLIENCLQSLQSLQKHNRGGYQLADNTNQLSALSANKDDNAETSQTMQTLKTTCLQAEIPVNKEYADFADNSDNFNGLLKENIPDEVII